MAGTSIASIDLEYQAQQDRPGLLRLYLPPGRGPFPTVVDVHGGAWNIGDRTAEADLDIALARAGILVAALDFRQADDAPYPASIADINLGIRWVKAHTGQFGGSAVVGAVGSSSGAHQALLCGLRPNDGRYRALQLPDYPDIHAELSYVVACWPIVDPLARMQYARRADRADLVTATKRYFGPLRAMRDGNPQRVIEERRFTHRPPLMIVQGGSDENIPARIVSRFARTYAAAGGDVYLREYAAMPHSFITSCPDAVETSQAIDDIAGFVHERHSRALDTLIPQ